jgi:hypothetical protein
MARYIGPFTWAYAILVGVILLTPRGPIPVAAYTVLGVVGIVLGIAGFALGRGRAPAAG